MAERKTADSGEGTAEKKTSAKPKTEAKAKPKPPAEASSPRRKPAAKPKPEAKPKPARKAAEAKKAPAKRARTKKEAPKAEAPRPVVVVRAHARYVRVAPRKARLVADQIRGMPIDKARAMLQFSPRSAAQDLRKLLDSAAANAENNHDLVADHMRIAEVTVNEGPTLRRYRPRALGRASRINKRTSHLSLSLTPEE